MLELRIIRKWGKFFGWEKLLRTQVFMEKAKIEVSIAIKFVIIINTIIILLGLFPVETEVFNKCRFVKFLELVKEILNK